MCIGKRKNFKNSKEGINSPYLPSRKYVTDLNDNLLIHCVQGECIYRIDA